ncbi:MAG: ABC transporter substrate-binding protein [Myxococcales bacterium]|nr:ABC transporter substrate-binding protein [Myxococcales bacterium]
MRARPNHYAGPAPPAPRLQTFGWLCALALAGCRIESAAPGSGSRGGPAAEGKPSGELWVYTSAYRQVIDELEPLLRRALPEVTVRWYQAGSEKVASRLEAELAAGGTQADVLMTSDPFLYERFKREGRLLRYASPNGLRIPRALMDLDGAYAGCRISTMVLVHRAGVEPPASFQELAASRWRGEVALGDPLTSGTSFTWAVLLERKYGEGFFTALRENGARVAGGNAAVLQKVESGEAKVGVVLLENALAAERKGSPISHLYPSDGAVIVPGYLAVFASSRNPVAARAFYDFALSREVQEVFVRQGDMHSVDPRLGGPGNEEGLEGLLGRAQSFDEAVLERGVLEGPKVKQAFRRAFSQ